VATNSNLQAVTDALLRARRDRNAADATPLASALQSADDAYAVQEMVAREMGWFGGAPPMHWKSGAASRSTPQTHAALPVAGVWSSPAQAGSWPFRMRGIEAEIAFRVRRSVDTALAATLDLESATALVDAMAVSIEIVNSRWLQGVDAPALLRLADLQSHGALVLGEWVPFALRDWSAQPCRVSIGSSPPADWRGSHACVDPAWVLAGWLRHATRDGQAVPAGTVVTTGTWVGLLHAQPGDEVSVTFDGIGRANVQL
jgi:2-keto-4-pentenoate hydratase